MIPEAYWKLLWHWGWLIAICTLAAAGSAFYLSRSLITFESRGIIEVAYLQRPDGTISFDDVERRLEAGRLAAELEGPWVTEGLTNILADRSGLGGEQEFHISISSPGSARSRPEPAVITIHATDNDPERARLVAELATETFADYLSNRQIEFVLLLEQQADRQTAIMEDSLGDILEQKRAALAEESQVISESTVELIEAHQRVLFELPLMLEDFRGKVGIFDGNLLQQSSGLDETVADLNTDILELGDDWRKRIAPALRSLLTAEAHPEYQLALIREPGIRSQYARSRELKTLLSLNGNSEDQIRVLAKSTSPKRVPVLGLKSRFLLAGGGIVGLGTGWVVANLLEYLVFIRKRPEAVEEPSE